MNKTPLMIGAIGAVFVFGSMWPAQECSSTDGGIPPGGPDPNVASCSTPVLKKPSWGQTPGGELGTDEDFESIDWVKRRITLVALGASAVPLALGLVATLILGRRSRKQ